MAAVTRDQVLEFISGAAEASAKRAVELLMMPRPEGGLRDAEGREITGLPNREALARLRIQISGKFEPSDLEAFMLGLHLGLLHDVLAMFDNGTQLADIGLMHITDEEGARLNGGLHDRVYSLLSQEGLKLLYGLPPAPV